MCPTSRYLGSIYIERCCSFKLVNPIYHLRGSNNGHRRRARVVFSINVEITIISTANRIISVRYDFNDHLDLHRMRAKGVFSIRCGTIAPFPLSIGLPQVGTIITTILSSINLHRIWAKFIFHIYRKLTFNFTWIGIISLKL